MLHDPCRAISRFQKHAMHARHVRTSVQSMPLDRHVLIHQELPAERKMESGVERAVGKGAHQSRGCDLHGAGQVVMDAIQQRLHPLVLVGTAAEGAHPREPQAGVQMT